jgi:hypothetical protein
LASVSSPAGELAEDNPIVSISQISFLDKEVLQLARIGYSPPNLLT